MGVPRPLPYTGIVSAPPFPAVELMHPTLVHEPFHRDGWVYEEKVAGYRMLACNAGDVRLVSRNARNHTTRFPGVTVAVHALGQAPPMLDGEITVFDGQLLSRFEWIRHRQPPDLATPPMFIAFDCLQAKGKDLRALPLHRRGTILEKLLADQALVLPVRRSPAMGWRPGSTY